MYYNMLMFSAFLFLILHTQTVFSAVGDASRKRCLVYSKLNVSNVYPQSGRYSDIINGELAKDGEFPHMGTLGYGNGPNYYWTCGCSLISDRFVLTAAHCTNTTCGAPKVVQLGTANLKSGRGLIYSIAKIIQNENFTKLTYDIALLRLNTTVTFSKLIRPDCLQVERNFDNSTLTAIGWGDVNIGGLGVPDLRKVGLYIYRRDECYSKYSYILSPMNISENTMDKLLICAGGRGDDRVDTCKGDSGGPLQIFSAERQYYIVGITVTGAVYCGLINFPSLYTRVSAYIGWIEENMQRYDVI